MMYPLYGLREGSWIRVENGTYTLKGEHTARLFLPKKTVEISEITLNEF